MAVNGVYIVQGELNAAVAMLRRGVGSGGKTASATGMLIMDEQDPLLRSFADLRDVLNSVNDLADMTPSSFLGPFLEVIHSEQTSGPVTGQALLAISKFLSYGLVDPDSLTAASAVQQIADAVTHARFVGTDPGSDEVVLLRILSVLRALLLTPVGALLTDEAVCEILQSCFRICFETRLSQLLRKAAESCITDMAQLLFTRLPTFIEDPRHPYIRRLKMRAGHKSSGLSASATSGHRPRRRSTPAAPTASEPSENVRTVSESGPGTDQRSETEISAEVQSREDDSLEAAKSVSSNTEEVVKEVVETILASAEEDEVTPPNVVVDVHGNLGFDNDECSLSRAASNYDLPETTESEKIQSVAEPSARDEHTTEEVTSAKPASGTESTPETLTNDRGVRFTTDPDEISSDQMSQQPSSMATTSGSGSSSSSHPRSPYSLPCVRELLRFLVALVNPLEPQNTEHMLELGLNLLIVALEAGADHLGNYSLLLPLIQNELCRALVALVSNPHQRATIFAGATRVGFLVFEALRTHLKFQFESYLSKLMELVTAAEFTTATGTTGQQSAVSSGASTPASVGIPLNVRMEQKDLALEALVQLWRVPGLVTELYLNYDCDLYCSNLFEEVTKLLSKNAFPAAGLTGAHLLSLDGLLAVVDTIETNCHFRMLNYKENQMQQQQHRVTTLVADEMAAGTTDRQQATTGLDGRRINSPTRLLPAASGYSAGKSLPFSTNVRAAAWDQSLTNTVAPEVAEVLRLPQVRPNRMPITSTCIPSHEDLIAQKQKKRLLATGTELFNQQPSKGVQFLQDHGLLRIPLCAEELVIWLKENPRLDKRKIAEYIVNRKNTKILEAFVRSFDFKSQRIDESLRSFLETFRLPGEAAEISMVIEHFADHWFKSNNAPFASVDAAFTLAYAVIMLNVDQHNLIAKRQQHPMNADAFKRNLTGVNGGGNFDQGMLEELYNAIRSEEIVMPAEHTGLIKENYLWKLLLKRAVAVTSSGSSGGRFVHAPSGLYDHDLFTLVWGPTVAAVSFVFDKSQDEVIVGKAIGGFRKCAAIAAHYGMSDVFDNLIINLCKFSTIASASSAENPDQLGAAFGENTKAQLATKAMFQLIHHHGDILREGWKNLLDSLGHLFRSRLLPTALTEVEDYSDSKGWISILKESQKQAGRKPPKSESGIFSSLYSWVGGGADPKEARGPTPEELELIKQSKHIIHECHPEQLVGDSKYLTSEALAEFLKSLVIASVSSTISPDSVRNSTGSNNGAGGALSETAEQTAVFYLELIISVAVENRDRLAPFWRTIRSHLFSLLSDSNENRFLTERAVLGLLRLATRLLSRDELTDEVLQSLSMLPTLKFGTVSILSRQMAYGLHELLRTNAANIHKGEHWAVLFQLLEMVGAAAYDYPEEQTMVALQKIDEANTRLPMKVPESQSDTEEGNQKEDVDRGYTSDTEVYEKNIADQRSIGDQQRSVNNNLSRASSGGGDEWTYVEKTGGLLQEVNVEKGKLDDDGEANKPALASLVLRSRLRRHDPRAYVKSCETLAFLVRDAAHITPENFDSCVRCLRTFIEAGLNGGCHYGAGSGDIDDQGGDGQGKSTAARKRKTRSQRNEEEHLRQQRRHDGDDGSLVTQQELDEEARRQLLLNYTQLALQLLDLTHALHVKASIIYRSWAGANPGVVDARSANLWVHCWRPLLQALARLCCDRRKQVRSVALTYLQRALLTHDLRELNAIDWENCFVEVLFPLLSALIDGSTIGGPGDKQQQQSVYDEIRVRASTLVCKVYLQHLCPLSASPSFTALWITLLDFMEKYLRLNSGDLNESIPESVKNLLLVMETAGVFKTIPGLVSATKERLMAFLPDLANGLVAEEDVLPVAAHPTEPIHAVAPHPTQPIHAVALSALEQFPGQLYAAPEPVPGHVHAMPESQPLLSAGGSDNTPTPSATSCPAPPVPVPVAPLEEVVVVQDQHQSHPGYPAFGRQVQPPSHLSRGGSPRASSLTRFGAAVPSPTSVDLMQSLIQQTPPPAAHIVLHPPAPGADFH